MYALFKVNKINVYGGKSLLLFSSANKPTTKGVTSLHDLRTSFSSMLVCTNFVESCLQTFVIMVPIPYLIFVYDFRIGCVCSLFCICNTCVYVDMQIKSGQVSNLERIENGWIKTGVLAP